MKCVSNDPWKTSWYCNSYSDTQSIKKKESDMLYYIC